MSTIGEAVCKLSRREDLGYDEARSVMDSIMSGECSDVIISSYLTALALKGETVEEIAASAAEMETSSSGSFRMISKNSRAGKMHSPYSVISAGTETVMPVSRL